MWDNMEIESKLTKNNDERNNDKTEDNCNNNCRWNKISDFFDN